MHPTPTQIKEVTQENENYNIVEQSKEEEFDPYVKMMPTTSESLKSEQKKMSKTPLSSEADQYEVPKVIVSSDSSKELPKASDQSEPVNLENSRCVKDSEENMYSDQPDRNIKFNIGDNENDVGMQLSQKKTNNPDCKIPDNPEEVKPEHGDIEDLTTCEYAYVKNSDQAIISNRFSSSSVDGELTWNLHRPRSASEGHILPSSPYHQQQLMDQNNLQLNILLQMHQVLESMQATYSSFVPTTSVSINQPEKVRSDTNISKQQGKDSVNVTSQQEENVETAVIATKAEMKKCLGSFPRV